MQYVGIQTQINRNNRTSVLLLLLFPLIILGLLWVVFVTLNYFDNESQTVNFYEVNEMYLPTVPWVAGGIAIWFLISYFFNSSMVKHATRAEPLMRKDNPRVYNIVENLCMSCGMEMPEVNIVQDNMLNAFASGIDEKSYAITLTTGIIDKLNDEELAGVVGHELTHIRNRDTKLLITCIIFVGIISTILNMVARVLTKVISYGGSNRSRGKGGGASALVVLLVVLVCCALAYVFTLLTRFAISRKREFMADAGGAELCGNPRALASALRKISEEPGLADVERYDIAELFIVYPKSLKESLSVAFSTHPDINERIRILEQF